MRELRSPAELYAGPEASAKILEGWIGGNTTQRVQHSPTRCAAGKLAGTVGEIRWRRVLDFRGSVARPVRRVLIHPVFQGGKPARIGKLQGPVHKKDSSLF